MKKILNIIRTCIDDADASIRHSYELSVFNKLMGIFAGVIIAVVIALLYRHILCTALIYIFFFIMTYGTAVIIVGIGRLVYDKIEDVIYELKYRKEDEKND